MKLTIESSYEFEDMTTQLTSKTDVETISIDNFEKEIHSERLEHFVELLSTNTTLKILKLTSFTLNKTIMEMLAGALNLNSTLESLSLLNCMITTQGITIFTKTISKSALQKLSISKTNFRDDEIAYLTLNLNLKFPYLRELKLSPRMNELELNALLYRPYQNITRSYAGTAEHIANMLKQNTSLRKLSLVLFNHPYMGIQTILKVLSANRTLQKLSVTGLDEKINKNYFNFSETATAGLALHELKFSISLFSHMATTDEKTQLFAKNIRYSENYKKLFLKITQLCLLISLPMVIAEIILNYINRDIDEFQSPGQDALSAHSLGDTEIKALATKYMLFQNQVQPLPISLTHQLNY